MVTIKTIRYLTFALLVAIIGLLLFCSDDNISGSGNNFTAFVRATVTDSVTANPIQGASVVAVNAVTGTASANGTTNSQGVCILSVFTDTAYFLQVSANGYRSFPKINETVDTFQVIQFDTTDKAVELVPLDAPSVVKAVIIDSADNSPIDNADVDIYSASTGQLFANLKSNSLGVCLFEVEAGLSYFLNVSVDNYDPYPKNGNAPDTFDVTGTDTVVQTIALTVLDTPAVVKVIVDNDSTGAPVKNAVVNIYKNGSAQIVTTARSDESGTCFLEVEDGFAYYLRISALAFQPYPKTGDLVDTFEVIKEDTIVRSISLTPIDSLTFIKVVVKDKETSTPIQNVTINLFDTTKLVESGESDNTGLCYFVVPADNSYYLRATHDGYYSYPLPYVSPEVFLVTEYDTTVRTITLSKKDSSALVIVTVKEDSTAIPIADADIIIFDTYLNQALARQMTDASGVCHFTVAANRPHHIKVSAQNYRSSPPPNGAPVPFLVGDGGSTVRRQIALKVNHLAVNCGTISGYVKSAANDLLMGCMSIGIRPTDSISVSGLSGPDGFYILYNVPEGSYDMEGYLEGWYQTSAPSNVVVTAGSVTENVNILMQQNYGSSLQGRITFLASQNSQIDVTLAHPVSWEAIPGLNTFMTDGQTYFLDSIPPGTYIPWASYFNDGYVMDPDWIRKFGLPMMTFQLGDSTKELNFSVTGAVPIFSPTNHPDTLIPVVIMNYIPVFKWETYPSAGEYIVGVYNSYGDLIWGGFDADNNVLHSQLGSKVDSIAFNFDSTATEKLTWFHSYRWKVWADKDASPGVQQLISSSEDWLGLFRLGERRRGEKEEFRLHR